MLLCQNAEGVNGERKVGKPDLEERCKFRKLVVRELVRLKGKTLKHGIYLSHGVQRNNLFEELSLRKAKLKLTK